MLSLLSDLDLHAAERPDAIALTTPGRALTFSELSVTVDAVATRLRNEGVMPRAVVGVDLPTWLEWIVDLALLRLATRAVSLRGVPSSGSLSLDTVITEAGKAAALAARTIQVDEFWVASATAQASGSRPEVGYPRPDSIFRLILTSGTTGLPRAAAYSVDAFERRRLGLDAYWTDARPELDLMGLSTTGGFHTAAASLRHGQAFRAVDNVNAETLRFAASEAIEVLCGSPLQIAHAMEILDHESIALPELREVRMAGAGPSAALLRHISSSLGVPVRGVYGSTEAGGVTMQNLSANEDPSNVGRPLAHIELQVVGDDGVPLAPGIQGTVRYRSPSMLSGYYEEGKVTPFPGGWFTPGDRGSLTTDGSLLLAGRTSEIINLAGLKVDPARVDALAAGFPGIRDAAAFGFEHPGGRPELGIAVVANPGCDLPALDRLLRQQLPGAHPTTYWNVAEIPRNRMGKAERATLAAAYERTLNAS